MEKKDERMLRVFEEGTKEIQYLREKSQWIESSEREDFKKNFQEKLHSLRSKMAEYFECDEEEVYIGNYNTGFEKDFKYKVVSGDLIATDKEHKNLDFSKLKYVGGNMEVDNRENINFEQLEEVGKDIKFKDCKNVNFEQLKKTGAIKFKNSENIKLGNLKNIDRYISFDHCSEIDLSQLNNVPGNARFEFSNQIDLRNLENIDRGITPIMKCDNINLGKLTSVKNDKWLEFIESNNVDMSNLESLDCGLVFGFCKNINLEKLRSLEGDIIFDDFEDKMYVGEDYIYEEDDDDLFYDDLFDQNYTVKEVHYFSDEKYSRTSFDFDELDYIDEHYLKYQNEDLVAQNINLRSLENLKGNLTCEYDEGSDESRLTDIYLDNLKTIGGNFWAPYKDAKNITPKQLEQIEGNMQIYSELSNLKYVGGNATFDVGVDCDLNSLETVGKNLEIYLYDNNLNLDNLKSVGGDLQVWVENDIDYDEEVGEISMNQLEFVGGERYFEDEVKQYDEIMERLSKTKNRIDESLTSDKSKLYDDVKSSDTKKTLKDIEDEQNRKEEQLSTDDE